MSPRSESLAGLRIDRGAEDARGPRRWPWLLATTAVVVVAALGWIALGGRPSEVTVAIAKDVAAGEAGPGTVLNASGYVTARRRATVSAKITGKVVEVNVEEGMAVKEGQVLARLDDANARNLLALAEAERDAAERALGETEAYLRQARLTLDRALRLRSESVVGQAELDAAQAEFDALAARLETAREQLEVARRVVALRRNELADTVIRAPFDGVAISKDAQPGEMVSPISAGGGFTRTGISTIVDMTSLEIEVDVNEANIQRVKPDQRVRATLDAYPDRPIAARVITTVPAADRQKATVRVRIAFDALEERILPDMGVKVAFLAEEDAAADGPAPPRVAVPRAAIRTAEGKDVVFVVKDDRAERRAVRVAAGTGDEAFLLSGIAAGERVVVEGPADLADGDRVRMR